ncbi:PKD domain-containing protein [Flavobacterium sp. Root420]|uniref:PKD domain-containing protein n=1 Tax=Flavobacterium sp. Root420 TaxID=1736533 RepID=UPI0006F981F6|nr:PKD domain-containing protein [Flavobacterium sp. Root420]KQX15083.1 hypothetical protein ASC72_17985 [Flavobacterium sp. Root420]
MKLKYTLVFTIISFFIATVGFAQTYSDKEIGFDVERVTASLKEKGINTKDIDFEISILRKVYTTQYISIKNNENAVLQKIKLQKSIKSTTNKTVATATDISPTEKAALQALYNSTNGPNWTNKNGWDFSTPVTTWDGNAGWYGITVTNGTVTGISLGQNNLVGTISPEIGKLLNLEFLSLGINQLSGSIPAEIGKLSKLTSLYLYHNELNNSIPVEVCNLAKLEALFLEYNNLTGSIPHEINKLTSLEFLNLSDNQLSGSIPVEIGSLYYNLQEIYFRNNQLSGPIPTEILLYNLVSLYLDNNKLSGPVPSNIDRLRNIGLLYLDHNQLTGTIPASIGNLPEAIHINLSNNQLTGTIPIEIGALPKIQMLDLSFNQLTGSIPSEIGNLTYIRSLFLNNNEFSGTIPSRLSQLTFIGNFYINNNKFRFVDFANEFESYKNFYGFQYSNQAKIDTKETLKGNLGGSITLTMCIDNRYTSADTFQWYKGQYPNGELITNATNRQYTISNLTFSNSGDYYCLSSHPQITILTNPNQNLVLERQIITLDVSCDSNVSGIILPDLNEFILNSNINFSFDTSFTNLIYDWTFYNLDGTVSSTATTNTVNKSYTAAGSYKVRLIITDQNGCKATFEKTVTIKCPAIAGTIKTSTPDVFVGTSTNFSLETTATDLSYKWTFTQDSESTIFTTKTVDYTYIRPGTNNVTLEVTDSNGCKSTFQKLVSLKTGSTLCNDITQFGRAFVQVGNDADLYKAATVSVNQTTNVTFSSQNYGPGADFEYKWSLLNENNQLVDSGTNLNFPITPTRGGFYTVVLDLKENTSGCVHQFTRAIICTIPNSCAQTNPESTTVKGLVINLLKNLMSRAMMGESDAQINSSAVTAEFNALKPYITSGPKDKIYNFASTRNLSGEFTSVDFSFSPDRISDIHVSVPHSLNYVQGMPLDYLQSSMIEPKLYIDLSQYTSANQYLVSCFTQQSTNKSLLKPNDCQYGSEIRYIDFCPNECDPLLGVVKVSTENPTLDTAINFSLETAATGLTYNWTFYNADNTVKENQTSSIGSQTYTAPGNYKIVIVATDSNNCATTFTKNINISSCAAVSGTIKTVSPNIFVGTTANFFFNTTATNLTYRWTLYRIVNSSTTTFTTSTANMYYDTPGNYNVKLVVTDTNGCTSTFHTTAVVTVKPPCVTVAGDIKTANPIIYTNETTTYSFDTTATNLTYNWTFHSLNNTPLGTATTSTASAVYPYTGNYVVTLVIVDENNCITTINKNITVIAKHTCIEIVGAIKTSTEKIKTNNNTIFSLQTTATNITYKWIFYNTNSVEIGTATTSTAEWTYTTPGDYLVALEITDQYACTTKLYKTVKVTEPVACTPLVGTIKMDTETPFLYTYATFTFETTATDLTYTWNVKIPEDGGYYNDPQGGNPFQLYLQYGEGEYTIMLDVTDSNDCVTHFEKKITPIYDCSRNSLTGTIFNRSNSTYYSPKVLINKPNEFTFWPYSVWNLNDLTLNWELTKLDDTPITTFTGEIFVFTPTTSDNLKLKLTIKDRNNCPHYFDRELLVTEACEFSGEDLTGFIAFENENNAEVSTIQINQTKELGFRPDKEISRSYTYKWEIYNANDELVESGNQEKHLLTLTTAGFYRVNVAIENEAGCILNFSKPVNCLIQNSCTNENPKSEIVKSIYLNMLKNLIARSLTTETDEHINASRTTAEFEALKPYITNGPRDKIYNYTTVRNEQGRLTSVRFSFSPDRDYDVQILMKKGLWNFDSDYDGTLTQFSANIASEVYIDLSQYSSSNDFLISCYVQSAQQISVSNPENLQSPERAQKTKKLSKISLNTNDCYKESEVRYINFCPAEACLPTVGVIKSGFSITYPSSQTSKNSQKPSSKL